MEEIKDLSMVSGGKAVETKDGKWVLMPPRAQEFDTKDEAEKFEEKMKERLAAHGGHHGKGPHHHAGHHGEHPKEDPKPF